MSNITKFRNVKKDKLNIEINKLEEVHQKASNDLDTFLAQQELKINNGGSWGEEDAMALLDAMENLAKASRELNEKRMEDPEFKKRYEAMGKDEDIFDKVANVWDGKVVPVFVPEDELDPYFD